MTRVPIGRRAFVAISAASLLPAQTGKATLSVYPPQRFLDQATEFDLFRLTDPQFTSWLPAPHLRFISRRSRFLVHASDRTGAPQAYRLDWRTGESRQLTAAADLDPATPSLSPDDRSLFYVDGPALHQVNLVNGRGRELDNTPAGWERAPGFSLSADGSRAAWVERKGGSSRLRSMHTLLKGAEAATAVEFAGLLANPQIRPGRAQALYRTGDDLRLASLEGGRADRKLQTEAGASPGQALWSPGGQSFLYLSRPADPKQLITLREHAPDQNTDTLVAKTSQFASFGLNGDASVFVGASRSLASPYILLLLRVARRELTLCEHRSSDPGTVDPVFSPDSQSIFFTSDRKSKRAIYRAHVEKFVEETAEE